MNFQKLHKRIQLFQHDVTHLVDNKSFQLLSHKERRIFKHHKNYITTLLNFYGSS